MQWAARPGALIADGTEELHLPSWCAFSMEDPLEREAVEKMLVGVSTRNGTARWVCRNVKRWQGGTMILRWCCALCENDRILGGAVDDVTGAG
jgi:hypothetical protein